MPRACASSPAMKPRATSESWYSSSASKNRFVLPSQRPQALVRVHAAAVDAVERLGHEGRVQPVQLGDRLERGAEGDRVVGRPHRVVVAEVDLVLADGDLVVARFDHDAELFERLDHLLAHVGRLVRGQVEVARLVVRQRLDARAPCRCHCARWRAVARRDAA